MSIDRIGILNVTLTLDENVSEPRLKYPKKSDSVGKSVWFIEVSLLKRGAMSPLNTSIVSGAAHVRTVCWRSFLPV